MCGIVSIFHYSDSGPVDRNELIRMRDRMVKRGPDGHGEWYSADTRVGMGHRRLAIIDISDSGAQPMSNEDGRIWIVFNGEIYNYKALRPELLAGGHRFRSNSDTEVIVHGYEEWGIEGLLHRLRGMFAFALYDCRLQPGVSGSRLILARDPFGIKPLYYADDGKTFRTASQVKALLAGGQVDTSPEPAGHVGFFLFGNVPEPYTMYKGIRALPAGSYMIVNDTGSSSCPRSSGLPIPKKYCSIPEVLATAECARSGVVKDRDEVLRAALLDSVRHHLVADVPVGAFLSSGIDSSTLTALASETSAHLRTLTLGFEEYRGTDRDETPLASRVAGEYGTFHSNIMIPKKDFLSSSQELFDAMDQPSIDGVNSYFVSRAAQQAGLKVALSGLGGDELFGGYPSFSQIPRMVNLFSIFKKIPALGRAFRGVSTPFFQKFTSVKYAGLMEYGGTHSGAYLLRRGMYMPWELSDVLDRELVNRGWAELDILARLDETIKGISGEHLKVAALETCWYMRNQLLRDTDWAGMAHSLEIRVPLVDIALVRSLAPLLSDDHRPTKQDLGRVPLRPLPQEICSRPKTGFSVPVREWIMGETSYGGERGLRGWARHVYDRFSGKDSLSSRHGVSSLQSKRVNQ